MKKIRLYTSMLIILLFIIALFVFVVSSLINLFKSEKFPTTSEIKEEIKDENLVVSHSTFYSIESAVNNFIDALDAGKYRELYNIIDEVYKKQYSYNEVKNLLTKYREFYFKREEHTDGLGFYYSLEKVYSIYDNKYLCILDTALGDFYLIIEMNNSNYNIILVDMEV